MSNKKAQGFHFSCLFSHFLWLIRIHLHWKTFWKNIFFSFSKHEFWAGAAGFSWCTPARYYGMMCFLKECFKLLYSLRASQLRPSPCLQSVFSRPCSLAPWPWLPGYKILFVVSEMLILMESNGFTFFLT